MIGVLAAKREPKRFSKLILVGPSPCYINHPGYVGGFERREVVELLETMDKNYLGWANFLAPLVMKNPDQPELTEELQQSFCPTDPEIARRFAEVTFFSDNRQDVAHLRVPSLSMVYAWETRSGSREFQASSAACTYFRAVSPVKGGKGGRNSLIRVGDGLDGLLGVGSDSLSYLWPGQ